MDDEVAIEAGKEIFGGIERGTIFDLSDIVGDGEECGVEGVLGGEESIFFPEEFGVDLVAGEDANFLSLSGCIFHFRVIILRVCDDFFSGDGFAGVAGFGGWAGCCCGASGMAGGEDGGGEEGNCRVEREGRVFFHDNSEEG